MRITTTTHYDNTNRLLVDLVELVVKRTIKIATVERRKYTAVSAIVDLLFQRDVCMYYVVVWSQKRSRPWKLPCYLGWSI